MPNEVSEDDLQKKREKVAKLQEQIRDEETLRAERTAAAQRELDSVTLDAEIARLENQLAQAKKDAQVSTVKDAASAPMQSAAEAMAAAEAQAKAAAEADKKKE